MNRSIRYKLLAYMTASILVFALLLYVANTFFAEEYYTRHKKALLIKTSNEIADIISGKNEALEFQDENLIFSLNRLEKSIGGSIVVGRIDGTLYYPVAHDPKEPSKKGFDINPFFSSLKRENKPIKIIDKNQELKSRGIRSIEPYGKDAFFIITKDPNLRFETLRFQTRLENDVIVSVWVPMAEISESAAVSNRLTGIIAILTIIITCAWAFYISDKFTKPITEMNAITKRMSHLDFSQTIDIQSEDEIGQLARSINHLSDRLDNTIGELNEKNRQLELDIDRGKRIDMMRREFVSNVSHELKTPIFLIQGYAEGLKANVADDEEKRNFYSDVIMEEAERMDVIVKDLLNLSQLESGTLVLDKISFDICELIVDVTKKMEPLFEKNDIQIDYDIDEDALVVGDPFRTEQVLTNFLNNAVNHVDKDGIIKLSAKRLEDKMRVSVYNTGEHIPKDAMEKIWTSFYKIDEARTREYGGTGLGLAIVKAIQDAHNNQYGVSNVEDGVEFWFDVSVNS